MATFRAATGGSATAATSFTATKPTGSVSGDFVCIGVSVGVANEVPTAASGWTVIENTANGASHHTFLVYRLLDGSGSDANPLISWTTSGRMAWVAGAITPAGGSALALDVEATVKVDTTAAATHTPNSATSANTVASLLFLLTRAGGTGITGITATSPTNWTEPATADFTTSGSNVFQIAAEFSYRLAQTGTVTPGSATTTGAATTTANYHHILVKETTAAAPATIVPAFTPSQYMGRW